MEGELTFITNKIAQIPLPILRHPDILIPFSVTTHAGDEALGAVLSQGPIGRIIRLWQQETEQARKELFDYSKRTFGCYLGSEEIQVPPAG